MAAAVDLEAGTATDRMELQLSVRAQLQSSRQRHGCGGLYEEAGRREHFAEP